MKPGNGFKSPKCTFCLGCEWVHDISSLTSWSQLLQAFGAPWMPCLGLHSWGFSAFSAVQCHGAPQPLSISQVAITTISVFSSVIHTHHSKIPKEKDSITWCGNLCLESHHLGHQRWRDVNVRRPRLCSEFEANLGYTVRSYSEEEKKAIALTFQGHWSLNSQNKWTVGQTWWCTPLIATLKRQRPVDLCESVWSPQQVHSYGQLRAT